MKKRDMVIAGYAETPMRFKTQRSAYDLAGEVLDLLLESTGISKDDIDGLSVSAALSDAQNPFFAVYMTEALGLSPSWLNYSGLGGCSITGGVARAMSAVRDGMCTLAVVLSADAPSSDWRANYGAYRGEFQEPPGVQGPPASFGLLMSRYIHQYGLDPEALGKIAVTQRQHALRNPNGFKKLQKELTMDEYMSSRVICDPLRVLDSVMYCDGANAFIVTSQENAKRLGLQKMVYPVAYAEVSNFNGSDPLADITVTGFSKIGPQVLQQAQLGPKDVRMFHPYDDFTIAVLMQLEAFGFCPRGQGSAYVMNTDLSFDGELPLNTGGGQISAGQPGLAGGGVNLAEAVRQMFGEGGSRQVKDPCNALVSGIGVIPYGRNWAISSAMVLEA